VECPLLGVKRTLVAPSPMSAFDPKRTLPLDSVVALPESWIRLGAMRSADWALPEGGGRFSAFRALPSRFGMRRDVAGPFSQWATKGKSPDSCYTPDGTCGTGSVEAVL
jgi:hypothetical protein